MKELERTCDAVRSSHPNAKMPWPVHLLEPFALQHFLIGEDLSVAGVAIVGKHFVKVRLTYFDDAKMRELMHGSLRELSHLVALASPYASSSASQ